MRFLQIIKDFFRADDDFTNTGLRQFCQTEYGKEWRFAYRSFETDGKFPKNERGIV